MKLLKELMEDEKQLTIDILVKFLGDNCSSYVNNHKNDASFLIRGIDGLTSNDFDVEGTGYVLETEADRHPRDTRIVLHTMINDFFDEKFGSRLRSEHVAFCYSNFRRAKVPDDYGDTYLIIPIGEYKMCYSPKIVDLFQSLDMSHVLRGDLIELFKFDDETVCTKILKRMGISSQLQSKILTDSETFLFNMYELITKHGPECKPSFFEEQVKKKCILDNLSESEENEKMFKELIGIFLDNDSSGIYKFFDILMESLEYQFGDFSTDTLNKSEVMLQCKKYLAVPNHKKEILNKAIDKIVMGDKQ
jgi:hypothetical protein